MNIKTYVKHKRKKLTKHFNLDEMHCHGKKCCSKTKIDIDLVKLAEKMRVALDCPITVESAYRCESHNKAVGGARGSGHCAGTALDITTKDISKERLAVCAELVGVPRIGIYDNKRYMAHIGTGAKCHWINTGNYLSITHSFLGGEWKKPKKYVDKNSSKPEIRWTQGWLFAKGYLDGKIDGVWGAKTQNAINDFRIDNGWKKGKYLKKAGITKLGK